jgi:hypothetical protein
MFIPDPDLKCDGFRLSSISVCLIFFLSNLHLLLFLNPFLHFAPHLNICALFLASFERSYVPVIVLTSTFVVFYHSHHLILFREFDTP